MRSWVKASTVCLATLLAGCAPGGDFDGPHGIKALYVGYSYVYVVPVSGGVVVVDAGTDTSAKQIKDAVGSQPILGVLVTHAHTDHIGGLKELGDMPVMVGRKEIPLLKGDEKFKGPAPRMAGTVTKPPEAPSNIVAADNGQVFMLGGHAFTAVAAPGHTPGSTAWLHGDVLFTGDAAVGGKSVGRSAWFFDDDLHQSDETVKALMSLDFTTMLDGHNGQTEKPATR